MNLKFCTILIIFQLGLANICFSQKTASPILTADSLSSGNYKDVLTSFFQLAFNNLTGPKKDLNFNSNPFAIMLKSNPELAIDRNYKKYAVLRSLNFAFGLKLDSLYKFNGFSSGIKYALLNNRDTTTSKLLFRYLDKDSLGIERDTLNTRLGEYNDSIAKSKGKELSEKIDSFLTFKLSFNNIDNPSFKKIIKGIIDTTEGLSNLRKYTQSNTDSSFKFMGDEELILRKRLISYKNSEINHTEKLFLANVRLLLMDDIPFKKLDPSFQKIVKTIAAKDSLKIILHIVDSIPNSSIKAESDKIFTQLKNKIKTGWLGTVGVSDTTYKDQFFFSNILVNGEIVKGLGANKPGSNFEFNGKLNLNFLDDTLIQGRNLKRCIFYTETGLNWVLRTKTNDQSLAELKFSASYLHNFTGLYAKEKRDVFMMNTTLRIRIIDDIWVPLEIKYDPVNGNFFGFLNVRANFTSLGKLLSSAK